MIFYELAYFLSRLIEVTPGFKILAISVSVLLTSNALLRMSSTCSSVFILTIPFIKKVPQRLLRDCKFIENS